MEQDRLLILLGKAELVKYIKLINEPHNMGRCKCTMEAYSLGKHQIRARTSERRVGREKRNHFTLIGGEISSGQLEDELVQLGGCSWQWWGRRWKVGCVNQWEVWSGERGWGLGSGDGSRRQIEKYWTLLVWWGCLYESGFLLLTNTSILTGSREMRVSLSLSLVTLYVHQTCVHLSHVCISRQTQCQRVSPPPSPLPPMNVSGEAVRTVSHPDPPPHRAA